MDLVGFYEKVGGDYTSILASLGSESLIQKLLLKFKDDGSMKSLIAAMEKKDMDAAFAASHTLKGVSLNLGFTRLSKSSSALTEKLRAKDYEDINALFLAVKDDYEEVISLLN